MTVVKSDRKSVDDLIYLISCALSGDIPDKERCWSMDLSEIERLCMLHTLSTLVSSALEKAIELPDSFKEQKFKAVRMLMILDNERKKVFQAFDEKGIWHMSLKGVVLKDLYPKPYMREMGDNDILVDPSKMEDIRTLMENMGYTTYLYGKTHHDVYFKGRTIEMEFHHDLFDVSDKEYNLYFRDIGNRLIRDEKNTYLYSMSDEDLYIFIMCHFYKHYSKTGAGLRPLIDIFLFNEKKRNSLDLDYVNRELKKLELTEFEKGVRELSFKVFKNRELTEDERRELDFFVGSSTHGNLENIMTVKLNNDDSFKAKFRYAIRRIFLDEEHLKWGHPVVYKYRVLYPFLVIYRPFKGLIRHRKFMVNEIKRLKAFKSKESIGQYNKNYEIKSEDR